MTKKAIMRATCRCSNTLITEGELFARYMPNKAQEVYNGEEALQILSPDRDGKDGVYVSWDYGVSYTPMTAEKLVEELTEYYDEYYTEEDE